MKFSSSLGFGGSKLQTDLSTDDSNSFKSFPWSICFLLAFLSLQIGVNGDDLSFAYVTFPMSVALASIYGRRYRSCVIYGTLPLLISMSYRFSVGDSVTISLGGGPISLYFANILAFDIFSSGGKRRKWLGGGINLNAITALAMLSFFYFSEFNHKQEFEIGIGWSLDPFAFLMFLFFLGGLSNSKFRPVFLLLALLALISILSDGLGYETSNGSDINLIMSKIFFQSTFYDLGKVFSLPMAYFIGIVARRRLQRKQASIPMLALSLALLGAAVFLDNFLVAHGVSSFSYAYYVSEGKAFSGDAWPPEYMDRIIRLANPDPLFVYGDFWIGTLLSFNFGLVIVCLFFLLGYTWGVKGFCAGVVVWVAVLILVLSLLDGLPPYAASESDVVFQIFGGIELLFDSRAFASVLKPSMDVVGLIIELAPDFVFGFFGVWLGCALDEKRSGARTTVPFSSSGTLARPANPLFLVGAWIGAVFISFELLSLVGVLLVWAAL